MTDCIQQSFAFQGIGGRKIEADFKGGNVSADGGVLLLREVDLRAGVIDQLANCFTDHRCPALIQHSVSELLRQRILGMAMGYEDLNDHDSLRRDPMMALGVGKTDPLGLDRPGIDRGRALAGKSTLNRLELTNAKTGSGMVGGVHKIHADHAAIQRLLVRLAVSRLDPGTEEVVLDFDATDSLIHGEQEGRFFHGYYDAYCYLPLYGFIGPWPVWAQLRTSNRDASDGTIEALQIIVPLIRERFPEARIVLRADSGFAREPIFAWCEVNGVFYVTGMAKNAALLRHLDATMFRAQADACVRGGWCTHFCEFAYRTAKSWSRARQVIGKAQVNPKGENPRFIVTNLPADHALREPERLYREFYCARGDAENRIKEQQLDLFADRMSCEAMSANQLRLWFSTFAYLLLIDLRETGLKGSGTYAKASPGIIRRHLLKIAAVVTVSVRRVLVRWSSSFRFQSEVAGCWERLRAAPA
jgi:hypothetical protein